MAVTVGSNGLLLGKEHLPLLAGAMHYFRIEKRWWGRCLDAVVELGLPVVESYVPWAVHERAIGRFDFGDGPVPDGFERDLGGFLEACAERGLKVILRPGPHINAELTDFGYPARITRNVDCQARGSDGNPVILPVPPRAFAVPSYASEAFHREASVWLKAFGDFVAPYCWPDGPVVAVQVDNELSLFFRTGAYDQDYHPDAQALYRQYLTRHHPDAVGTDPEPPRRFDATDAAGLVRHLDWVASKEWMVVRALDRMARVLRMCGLDRVVLFHNFPTQRWGAPCSLPAVEQVLDLAGLDIYLGQRDYAAVKSYALSLAGSSRLPFVPELGCGVWPWWFPYVREDQQSVTLNLLMHGVRAFNLYMAVERDRWYGSPIGADGRRQGDHFAELARLIEVVRGTDTQPGLTQLNRSVAVGLMLVRDYERLALCSALSDPFPPAALDLLGVKMEDVAPDQPTPGLDRPVARDYARVLTQAAQAMDQLQVPYHYVDSDLPLERLARYKLLVVPAFCFMDEDLLRRLAGYVDGGGRLLLLPTKPTLDGRLELLSQPVPEHILFEGTDPLVTLRNELDRLGVMPDLTTSTESEVDLAVWQDAQGITQVVFVANRSEKACTAQLRGLSPENRVWDALGGQPVDPQALALKSFEVRVLRVSAMGDRPHA